MSAHGDRGAMGERAARAYLEAKGLRFVGANLRVGRDEVDLLMREGETLVFVEVKLRKDRDDAPFAVDAAKQRRISRAAVVYLAEHGLLGRPARFDVVSVEFVGARLDVRHIENAFPLARGRYFV